MTAPLPAWRARFSALLFDLDGTLVETAPDLCHALNHALSRLGRPPVSLEGIRAMIGDGARHMLTRATADDPLSEARLDEAMGWLLEHYWAHVADESRAFADVPETLDTLAAAGGRLAVVTNKPAGLSAKLLDLLGLAPRFEAIVGADSLAVRKPDAGHVLGTLAMLDVPPEQAVMIGDSANDVNAARNAGIPVIAVSFGYTTTAPSELGADLVIDRFGDLAAALDSLAAAPTGA